MQQQQTTNHKHQNYEWEVINWKEKTLDDWIEMAFKIRKFESKNVVGQIGMLRLPICCFIFSMTFQSISLNPENLDIRYYNHFQINTWSTTSTPMPHTYSRHRFLHKIRACCQLPCLIWQSIEVTHSFSLILLGRQYLKIQSKSKI